MMPLSGGPAGGGWKKREPPPRRLHLRHGEPFRKIQIPIDMEISATSPPPAAMTVLSGGPAGGGRISKRSTPSSPSPPRRATPQICKSDLQRGLSRQQGPPVAESVPISPSVNPPASVRALPDGWPEGLPWELPIFPTKEEWAEAERETKMLSRQLGIDVSSSSEEDLISLSP